MVETGLDISQRHYENAAGTLQEICEQITGLPLPFETLRAWKVVLGATRIIDDRLDASTKKEERGQFTLRLMRFLNGHSADLFYDERLDKSLRGVKKVIDGLPETKKKSFLCSIARVFRVTEEIKTETKPLMFAGLTRLEGQVFAKVFAMFLPEVYQHSPKYSTLMKVLTRLGRAANCFDTFVDLQEDYRKSRSRIQPTVPNRVRLLGAVTFDGIFVLRKTKLPKSIVGHFANRARETILKSSE